MQIHGLKPKHKRKKRIRVGRGGKRGTYSGRGLKGQKSRAGKRMRPAIRDIIKRIPKLKGVKFKISSVQRDIVNVGLLDKRFKQGAVVSPKALLKERLVRRNKGRIPRVKVLGDGEIKKKLTFQGVEVSASALKKIKKAGGVVKQE